VEGGGVAVGVIVGGGDAVGVIVGISDTLSRTTTIVLGVSIGADDGMAVAGVEDANG